MCYCHFRPVSRYFRYHINFFELQLTKIILLKNYENNNFCEKNHENFRSLVCCCLFCKFILLFWLIIDVWDDACSLHQNKTLSSEELVQNFKVLVEKFYFLYFKVAEIRANFSIFSIPAILIALSMFSSKRMQQEEQM